MTAEKEGAIHGFGLKNWRPMRFEETWVKHRRYFCKI